MRWFGEDRHLPRPLRRAGRFVARTWQVLVVALVAVSLGVAACLSPGLMEADVRLDDGTVYAGNRNLSLVGTVNTQIEALSDAAPTGDTNFRILQHDDLVLVHSIDSDRLSRYNPGTNRLTLPTQLPAQAQVQFVGSNLLVVSPTNGQAWAGPAERLLEYDFDKEQADLEIGENGVATLTTSGEIIGLDPNRSVLVRKGPTGEEITELPFETDPLAVAISAVGDQALVLDRAAGRIWLEGMAKPFDVSGAGGAQLMAPVDEALGGEDGTRAIYATQAGLIALTADGPRSLSGQLDGDAVPPIQVGDCAYGAFGNRFVRKCVGEEAHLEDIPSYPADAELVFGANRATVILNDLAGGNVWLVDRGMKLINNWEEVTPRDEEETEQDPEVRAFLPPERDEANKPPVANDDALAARAGRSTTLPVLDNDTDPDGDILTISAPAELTGARLSPVRNGAGLQISIDPGTTGTLTFTYEINDGRENGTATAEVTVEVLPLDPTQRNTAPNKFALAQDVEISQRQILDKQVLLDWRDADGDPLMLKDAWLDEGAEDRVAFTSDGSLTFTDVGKTTGPKTVHLLVSDGFSETEGELRLNVAAEPVSPVAYGDFATTTVGEAVEIEPIANDVGYALRLTEVTSDCERCTLQPNYAEDKFTFQAPQAGTYYLTYTVRSAEPAVGLVRIDVRADGTGTPPIAALDVAMLPPGGSVTIDPLLNDTDADGDVLVIQTLSQPTGLEVQLERRHLVRITARSYPSEPITMEYRVSDGHHSVVGHIVVIPSQTTGTMKPQPRDDSISVRAGSTVDANVLTNDESPVGLELKITRLLRNPFGDDAWIDDDQIRLRAPAGAQATSTSIDYEVADTDGRVGVATLQVEVSAEDSNAAAPQPRKVVDRVLSGTTTRIPIDLTGIDPTGSSVRLVGVASGPTLGRVVSVGEKYLTYEAYSDSQGTDTFLYEVINRMGMRATGQVRIGVAPPGTLNAAPTGVVDEVSVRPGRTVQLAALSNDFDLDGDTIGFAAGEEVTFQDPQIKASVVDHREISLVAPEEPGNYGGSYAIVDGRGQVGTGTLIVNVDPKAPLAAPVTRDDTVLGSTIVDKDWVEVDVLANDYDPDGAHDELRVRLADLSGAEDDPARVTDDGRRVSVRVLDQMQQVRYIAVDDDGNETYGVITVPGRGDSVPVLRTQDLELEAVAGQPLTIDLNEHVVGTQGREVRLTTADHVSATQGLATPDGPTSIRYVADELYEGPASVVFEVTDVVPEGDTTAKTAFIALRIKVTPAPDQAGAKPTQLANEPPVLLVSNPVLEVAPGEGDARLDLSSLFRDPEGQDVFVSDLAVQSGDERIVWRLEGTTLAASTAINTPSGVTRTITGNAYDASTGQTPFTVQLVVITSRQPLTQAQDDHVAKATAGTPVTIPVLANDVSFVSDKTLTVVDARVISGSAKIEHTGDGVTITPTSGTNGTLIATYTVADATRDPARHVDGRITVEVQDRPARPLTPYPSGAADGEVTVTYASGGDGGSPVTRRIATASSPGEADVVQDCPGERCTVTGLRNGRPWTVSIVEVNEVGSSQPSPPSAPQTPDAKPLPPSRPTVDYGDSKLTVSWTHDPQYATALGGSPIQHYLVTLLTASGAEIETRQVPSDARSYTWEGLANGTTYLFRVVAANAQLASDPSEESLPEHPSAPPSGNQELGVSPTANEIGGAFNVTFDASRVANNGAGISEFIVTPITQSGGLQPGKAVKVSGGTGRITVAVSSEPAEPTKFQLEAVNRSGKAVVGGSSQFRASYKLPKIESFKVSAGDGELRVAIRTNSAPGTPERVQYNIGRGWANLPGDGVIRGLTNGQGYVVQARVLVEDMTSPVLSYDPQMPQSAKPNPLSLQQTNMQLNSSGSTLDSLQVSARVPAPSWIDAGGWDPGPYKWCGGLHHCTPTGRPGSVTLTPGRQNSFSWSYSSNSAQNSGTQDVPVAGIKQPSFVDGILNFQFPYANQPGDYCAIQTTTGGQVGYQDVYSVNGTVGFTGPVSGESIVVICKFNGKTFDPVKVK